MSSGKIKFLID